MTPDLLIGPARTAALAGLPGWSESADGRTLSRDLVFADFAEAFAMMTRIALLAEKANHHPDWSNAYNRLSIRLTTHEAGGLTSRDIALAHAINAALGPRP